MIIDTPSGSAIGVNNNGTIIVGTVGVRRAYSVYWTDGSPPIVRNMGFLKDGKHTVVFAVSDDGGHAVGSADTTGGVERAFRWKKHSIPEMEDLGVPTGYVNSEARDVNNVGDIIVGNSSRTPGDFHAFRWHESNGLKIEKLIEPPEATTCLANGTNDDGTVIVGFCRLRSGYDHAICWLGGTTTEVTELECLGSLSSAYAYAISGDGNVIVGNSTSGNPNIGYAVRWKRNPGTKKFNIENLNVLPDPPQDSWIANAFGVNYDGSVIVGQCLSSSGQTSEAFIWREDATPKVQKLEDADKERKASAAFGVTKKSDGTIIAVGRSTFLGGGQIAVRWNNLSIDDLHFPS